MFVSPLASVALLCFVLLLSLLLLLQVFVGINSCSRQDEGRRARSRPVQRNGLCDRPGPPLAKHALSCCNRKKKRTKILKKTKRRRDFLVHRHASGWNSSTHFFSRFHYEKATSLNVGTNGMESRKRKPRLYTEKKLVKKKEKRAP